MQIPTAQPPLQGVVSSQGQDQPKYVITEADKKRIKLIANAWKAYNGELDPPLEPMPGEPDDNVMTNRMAPVVNAGVDFLFGKELEISVEEGAPAEAQKILDKVWGRKEARIPLLQKLAMNGAVAGHAFLRIVPEPTGTFRLVIVDPSTVYVQTAPQDCETVLLYCIQYCVNQQIKGQSNPAQVYYREEIARIDPDGDGDDGNPFADLDASWQIQHWTRVGDRSNWVAAGKPIIWPYPFPPLFSCQNLPKPNDTWGYPDITPDGIGLNNALNLVLSCVNRTLKLYGNPLIYATGTGEQIIDIRPGKIIGLPLSESKIVAVAITSDVANAKQFADDLRSDIDELTSVPGMATARVTAMPSGNMSGIAIELCFLPLNKKTDKKKCSYGELIINVSKALFVLNGLSGDIDITLAWESPMPHNDLESAQTAIALRQIGVSNVTLQRERGYDPEEEYALKHTEDARKIEAMIDQQAVPPLEPLEARIPETHPVLPLQGDVQGGQHA